MSLFSRQAQSLSASRQPLSRVADPHHFNADPDPVRFLTCLLLVPLL